MSTDKAPAREDGSNEQQSMRIIEKRALSDWSPERK
jgi:hypothetical protein